ncbi:hypothetical protein [Synechococcus sp. PCC 7336]|uniref:hypothetical protein n=1 Tax=Synechococcus sp. PCC 7336 TaxID=195250 RepID=UPI000348B686|nr:hypothetical protein [Synechococcus sp. PCC 7336]
MIFWFKADDGSDWQELPPQGNPLSAGKYSIAVQSPQPHFKLESSIRHYCHLPDGTRVQVGRQSNTCRTNNEGMGWIGQHLELLPGIWEISCQDGDLIAELFGEGHTDSITFEVADLASDSQATETAPDQLQDGAWLHPDNGSHGNGLTNGASVAEVKQFIAKEQTGASVADVEQIVSNAQTNASSAVATDRFSLMRTRLSAVAGEVLTLTGRTRCSGCLDVTAGSADGSVQLLERRTLTLRPGAQTMAFSLQLQLPEVCSGDLAGVAYMHPQDGSPSLRVEFTVSIVPLAEGEWRASKPASQIWKIRPAQPGDNGDRLDRAEAETFDAEEPDRDSTQSSSSQIADLQVADSDRSTQSNPPVTEAIAVTPPDAPPAAPPELQSATDPFPLAESESSSIPRPEPQLYLDGEELPSPAIAFASDRDRDRTFETLLALFHAAIARQNSASSAIVSAAKVCSPTGSAFTRDRVESTIGQSS